MHHCYVYYIIVEMIRRVLTYDNWKFLDVKMLRKKAVNLFCLIVVSYRNRIITKQNQVSIVIISGYRATESSHGRFCKTLSQSFPASTVEVIFSGGVSSGLCLPLPPSMGGSRRKKATTEECLHSCGRNVWYTMLQNQLRLDSLEY